ncbi:30S ribosomal protein S16 [Roseiconus nitratireducens]|uniref:Small ribosomal subunit protein bS16 n=1 Tax=Roseiconus nitratireducens TaxID=2605748 RepID=A0A5M6DDH6_9BACT|nr:30S ribosomal protein S16 [Roseiconus nitratireducens]KAA5544460.1 30S ribosomal protein S16 [Roseiconus nitratireducens]
MAVRIRLKKMGRTHRPFFRVCAMDQRSPRDGRVIEELGFYDPMLPETDARAQLKADRIDHWLSVGAQPSEKVAVLIKKYGTEGTHLEAQKEALERLGKRKEYTPAPQEAPKPAAEAKAEEPAEEAAAEETPAEDGEAKAETEAATE